MRHLTTAKQTQCEALADAGATNPLGVHRHARSARSTVRRSGTAVAVGGPLDAAVGRAVLPLSLGLAERLHRPPNRVAGRLTRLSLLFLATASGLHLYLWLALVVAALQLVAIEIEGVAFATGFSEASGRPEAPYTSFVRWRLAGLAPFLAAAVLAHDALGVAAGILGAAAYVVGAYAATTRSLVLRVVHSE